MKRLLAFGLAMAVAGGAYAQIPYPGTMVYDFKAVVKNTNIKSINVNPASLPFTFAPPKTAKAITWNVAVKYVQNTVLYGYVIDGGDDWTWAVIANQNNKTKIGHLFYCEPQMVQLFDPKFKKGTSIEDPWTMNCGVEGGIVMWQGEEWEGDNVLWVPEYQKWVSVQEYYESPSGWEGGLFGWYDDYGDCWLAGVGFGSAVLKIPQVPQLEVKLDERTFFTMNMAGSIIGGWNYCYGIVSEMGFAPWFPIDMWICGEHPDDIADVDEFNSWIAGTWTLKSNTKLEPEVDQEYGPCYTAGALKAINPRQDLEESEDYQDYP